MQRFLTILLITITTALMISCGADQAMKKGDKLYAIGEYYGAATQYRKAYSQTPAKERTVKGQRAMKMAECYRRINFTTKAITAYNNAVRYKQADSLTHFHLGQLYLKNGNYKEAAKQFQTAIDSLPETDFHWRLAKTGLQSAQMAPQWKKDGSDYIVKREGLFNSPPPPVIRPKATSIAASQAQRLRISFSHRKTTKVNGTNHRRLILS